MHTKNHIIKTGFIFSFSLKNRRFGMWKRRSFQFLFQIFAELISFFKGFGVGGRFAGAVQTAY